MNQFTKTALFSFMFATAVVASETTPAIRAENSKEELATFIAEMKPTDIIWISKSHGNKITYGHFAPAIQEALKLYNSRSKSHDCVCVGYAYNFPKRFICLGNASTGKEVCGDWEYEMNNAYDLYQQKRKETMQPHIKQVFTSIMEQKSAEAKAALEDQFNRTSSDVL